jgi:hypothetical protein
MSTVVYEDFYDQMYDIWKTRPNKPKMNMAIEAQQQRDNFGMVSPKPADNNPKTVAALLKPRLSDTPPIALYALGAAMSDGANKYGRFNYRQTNVTASVFYDAMMRHLTAWYSGEDFATDSKLHHMGHIMASCAIVLDAQFQGTMNDDRDARKPFNVTDTQPWKSHV